MGCPSNRDFRPFLKSCAVQLVSGCRVSRSIWRAGTGRSPSGAGLGAMWFFDLYVQKVKKSYAYTTNYNSMILYILYIYIVYVTSIFHSYCMLLSFNMHLHLCTICPLLIHIIYHILKISYGICFFLAMNQKGLWGHLLCCSPVSSCYSCFPAECVMMIHGDAWLSWLTMNWFINPISMALWTLLVGYIVPWVLQTNLYGILLW